MPDTDGGVSGSGGEVELADQSMSILASLHAAMVNFHLYPPTSDIVEESVRRALDELQTALYAWGSLTFSELEGKLMINDFRPDERDQEKPNTVAFLKDLALWEVRSITFDRGLNEGEIRGFLEVFSRKRADRALEGSLSEFIAEKGIQNITVDEKIYVSLSKDQDPSAIGAGGPVGDAMDLLKDEVFVRYLVGTAPSMDASLDEVSDMMSDPERINTAFQSAMLAFERGGGEAVGPEKAGAIRDTVDRMYGLVDRLADEELKETLHDEMVNILAALDPEVLVDVLSEEVPEAVREPGMRREIISSVEGENVLRLTEQVIEKYEKLLSDRESMDPQDYHDISSVLNEIVADLYQEGDASFHPEITRMLRQSGLMEELARSHPQAGREMKTYTVVTDIRAAGSLRPLEGLSDEEVIEVTGKMLDMGEGDMARRIIAVTTRNLESDRPDFRARACRFLKEIHVRFKERGRGAEMVDRASDLVDILEKEEDAEVSELLIEFLGNLAEDLFVQERLEEFSRLVEALVFVADNEENERMRRAARGALSSLNPWDVGKPLATFLFGEDEQLSRIAAKVLPYIEGSLTAKELIDHLKKDEDIKVTMELAEVACSIGEPVLSAVEELMDSNIREEVYLRALDLLEAMGTPAALSVVKAGEANPIPAVRAASLRAMARMAPGDPSLMPHFLQALEDGEVDVRREGVRGLGTIDDSRSVDTLISIIQGKSPGGGEEHPRVEEAACLALARLGPEKAVGEVSDLLRKRVFSLRKRSTHPRVKAAACYTLGQIGGPEVVDLIRDYLDDSDPIVRNEARKAIGVLRKRGYT